jgi:hypothetical protein
VKYQLNFGVSWRLAHANNIPSSYDSEDLVGFADSVMILRSKLRSCLRSFVGDQCCDKVVNLSKILKCEGPYG